MLLFWPNHLNTELCPVFQWQMSDVFFSIYECYFYNLISHLVFTIWYPGNFQPFEYRTCPVFRFSLYLNDTFCVSGLFKLTVITAKGWDSQSSAIIVFSSRRVSIKDLDSGDLNNQHLNDKLLLVQYSDVRYSNGGLNTQLNSVWYSNGIQILGYLAIRHFSTIWIPD